MCYLCLQSHADDTGLDPGNFLQMAKGPERARGPWLAKGLVGTVFQLQGTAPWTQPALFPALAWSVGCWSTAGLPVDSSAVVY